MSDYNLVSDRAELKALDLTGLTADQSTAYLSERGREGQFILRSQTPPYNDPQEGIYVVSDTSGFYWERVLDGGRITFRMFGADGTGATTSDTAINAAFNLLRLSLAGNNLFLFYIDGEELTYKHNSSINITDIKGRGHSLVNTKFLSNCTGDIALDFTGSRNFYIDRIFVRGDATNTPSVGFFFGRIDDGGDPPYPTAQGHTIGYIEYFGTFEKAGFINLASEVMHIDRLKGSNDYWSNLATCSIFSGHSDVLDDYCGLPDSKYQPIGLGSQSLSSVTIDDHNAQRAPAYGYTITGISKSNPAIVTISSADASDGNTNYGLDDGKTIFLDRIIGTNVAWQAKLSFKVFTIANLNVGAGTFELSGVDTSNTAGTFESGTLRNNSGPSTVLGQVALYKEGGGYQVVHSDAHYRLDIRGDPDWNWGPIILSGRHETGADHLVKVVSNVENNVIRNLRVESDNVSARVSVFKIGGVTGSGDVSFYNLEVVLGHPAQTPTIGLFDDPSVVNLYGGRIDAPSSAFVQPVSDFKASSANWVYGTGEIRQDGAPVFSAPATNSTAAKVELVDNAAAQGPFFDIHRESVSPATADTLGMLRFTGKDDAGNVQFYGGLRVRIQDASDGSEDARLQVLTAINGVTTESHYFEGGMLRFRKTYNVADLPNGTVGAHTYANDGRKNGETAGNGTGVPVFHDGTNWCAYDTGQPVES